MRGLGRPSARARRERAPRLVFVDHDKNEYLEALRAAGYHVTGVSSMKKALAVRPRPDGLILELMLPDRELPLLSSTPRAGQGARAMTLVALAGADRKRALVKAGAVFCPFPCPPQRLLAIVRRAVPLPGARRRGL